MKAIKWVYLLLLCMLTNVCIAQASVSSQGWVVDDDKIWRVEIVDDDYSRARGLMFRPHLLPNAGMLFVFDHPRAMSFWMKNTWLNLDIRFYDSHGHIITHYPYATPCFRKQCKQYSSSGAIKYVLETASMFRINQQASDLKLIIVSQ